jgi:hypothetical protein
MPMGKAALHRQQGQVPHAASEKVQMAVTRADPIDGRRDVPHTVSRLMD